MNKLWLLAPLPLLLLAPLAAASEELPSLSTLLVPGLIVIVLVVLNGFFVAAEFAIIGVRPSEIDKMVQDGNGSALEVQSIQDSPVKQDRYIATAQLGITVASLGLGMYGEPKIAEFIEPYLGLLFDDPSAAIVHTVGSIIALSLLTYLHVVIGEMVPKSLALSAPDKAVLRIARPMRWAQAFLGIPVRILNSIGRAMLRLFKIVPAEGHARFHSAEELELIVSESAEGGLLLEEEEEMIRRIFDFSERQVGQVMTARPKVQAIPLGMPLEELLGLIKESRHSRFPVFEGDLDHVVGILHLKDLARQQMRSRSEQEDLRLILRPAPAVPEDQPVEKLLAAFKRQRIHMAIVLDEFGGLSGIVTLEDLVEEIVGEVRDEFDLEKEPFEEIEPGVLEMAGTFLVHELTELVYLGEAKDMPDVDTIGGLIHTWLGRPPQLGEKVSSPFSSDVIFTVLDVDGLAVGRARVEFPVSEDVEEETAEATE